MAHAAALIDTLKRELRARKLTYATVARKLEMSEIGVKRMFSRRDFTLARLDQLCAVIGLEFTDLARLVTSQDNTLSQLTIEQEKEFVANHKLMLVALCALNHWRFERIVSTYELSETEAIRLLVRLEKLRFIELLPNNRIRLLVSRAFSWIPNGPIQTLFKERMQTDFFRSAFEREEEFMLLANGALSKASVALLAARLKRLAVEFAELRHDDAGVPEAERLPVTLLLGMRPWEPELLGRYRRAPARKVSA